MQRKPQNLKANEVRPIDAIRSNILGLDLRITNYVVEIPSCKTFEEQDPLTKEK